MISWVVKFSLLTLLVSFSLKGYNQTLPYLIISPNDTLCPGDVVLLTLVNSSGIIQWSTGSNQPTISISSTADTALFVINDVGGPMEDTLYANITIFPHHSTFIHIHDTPTCVGTSVAIYLVNPVNNVLWSNGNTDPAIYVTPDSTTDYYVINDAGTNCADTVSMQIVVLPETNPLIAIIPNDTVCYGQEVILQVQNPVNSIYWSTGDTSAQISITASSDTSLTVTNDFMGFCPSNMEIKIAVLQTDILENSIELTCDPILELIPDSDYPLKDILWSTSDTTYGIIVSESGLYSITANNGFCVITDSINVAFSNGAPGSPWIPNAFTPNGDNLNEYFQPIGMIKEDYSFSIFDRWGRNIFTTTDINSGWDGQNYPVGIYTFLLNYKNSCTSRKEIKTDYFMLLK